MDLAMVSRRRFLARISAMGATPFLGMLPAAAEPLPEVRSIRLIRFPAICTAPAYVAEEFLRAEGFEEIEYVPVTANTTSQVISSGKVDLFVDSAPGLVKRLDTTDRVVALGGIHAGCYELFAAQDIRAVHDLKGRTVSVSRFGATEHIFMASMLAYVGIDPGKDINWIEAGTSAEAMRAFSEGRADGFLGFAPQPQQLRARKIGHVIVDTTYDRPWSQYFCCMLTGNRDFIERNPIATKRAARAFLKATDVCATQPERVARLLTDRGYTSDYAVALEVLKDLPFQRWRDANPEDTLRFHALRLHEVGMIKTSPQKLVVQGSDWRFFDELKKELKV